MSNFIVDKYHYITKNYRHSPGALIDMMANDAINSLNNIKPLKWQIVSGEDYLHVIMEVKEPKPPKTIEHLGKTYTLKSSAPNKDK